jgi:chaperone required for assembly of F1-ATPase
MTGWAAKRFWKQATTEAAPGGFTVRLDARPLKTPAKAELVVPTRAMAEAIAAEWDAQADRIDPRSMPVTRSANSAIDKVIPQKDEVVSLIAAYGASDLLCYRAETPAALVARQSAAWDPWLARAGGVWGPLTVTSGVVPVAQPEATVAALRARVSACSPFELAALYDLVAISGSLILGLAVAEDWMDVESAWKLSRIDDDWQIEHWGEDAEAADMAAFKAAEFAHAGHFWKLARIPA